MSAKLRKLIHESQSALRLPVVEQIHADQPLTEAIRASRTQQVQAASIVYHAFSGGNRPPHHLSTPESIVNAAVDIIRDPNAHLDSHQVKLAGLMLSKMDLLGIRWNKKALPSSMKHAMGLREATTTAAVKPPTEVDRMRERQAQEKIALQQRQANELMAAKLRDVQQKAREAERKRTQPKSVAKPSAPTPGAVRT